MTGGIDRHERIRFGFGREIRDEVGEEAAGEGHVGCDETDDRGLHQIER